MNFISIMNIVETVFLIYQFMIFAYILMSWVPSIQQSAIGEFLGKMVEPYLGIFRRFIPPIGMIDISPIVALFALRYICEGLLIVLQNVFVWLS